MQCTGKEVSQPLVSCPASFAAWREEAFQLWTSDWAACYEEGSAAKAVLQTISSTWYLVSVTDNNVQAPSVFQLLSN